MTAVPTVDPYLDPWTPDVATWHDRAACAAACRDPHHPATADWWDVAETKRKEPEPTGDNLAALEVCDRCEVINDCLADAHPRHDAFTIRGGLMPADWRRSLAETVQT